MDELFAADPTGRSSGFAAVAKPVPKKDRSKKKGDALSAMPAVEDLADVGGSNGGDDVAAAALESAAENGCDEDGVAELHAGSTSGSDAVSDCSSSGD